MHSILSYATCLLSEDAARQVYTAVCCRLLVTRSPLEPFWDNEQPRCSQQAAHCDQKWSRADLITSKLSHSCVTMYVYLTARLHNIHLYKTRQTSQEER